MATPTQSPTIRDSPQRPSALNRNGSQLTTTNMAAVNDPNAQEREFSSVTDKIDNIPDEVSNKAMEIWLNLIHTGRQEFQSDHQSWIVCSLYVAVMEHRLSLTVSKDEMSVSTCLTLTQLLKSVDMNIITFFKRLRTMKSEVSISEKVSSFLTSTERKYFVVAPLYNKFQQIYSQVFQDDQDEFAENRLSPSHSSSSSTSRMNTCWCLFVLAKSLMLENCNELVLPFQLLLCCIDHAVRVSPTFLLKPPFDTAQSNHYATSVVTENNSNSLRLLCEQFNCDHNDVLTVLREYWQKFLATLPMKKIYQGLDGLPECEFLKKQYNECYTSRGDFDEILFLESDTHLIPSTNPSCPSPPASSHRHASTVNATPIRAAMNTVQALQSILCHASDMPSPALIRYFNNCPVNPSSEIDKRNLCLQTNFVNRFLSMTGMQYREIAKKRWQLSVRLYYRVMEAMLKSEEERLSMSDFSTLLHNDTFHKSLLAAAIEVVMVTYGGSWSSPFSADSLESEILFPWILDVFQLKGFDFYKVIESFVRAESKLTRDIVKHLHFVESQILESIAWKSDSPLFKFDSVKLAATTSQISIDNSTLPTTTAADMYLSPLRSRHAPPSPQSKAKSRDSSLRGSITSAGVFSPPVKSSLQLINQSGKDQSSGSSVPPRSQTLNLFYNKVLRLAYTRLQALCKELVVTLDLERFIWTTVEYCVTHRPELLKDRHLDQVMLCCIYGVCKAADSELRFKDIVAVYRRLYQSSQHVYKSVLINGEEYDSIIGFYNRIFMPSLKMYILQFQPNRQKPMLSPVPTKCQSGLTSPSVIRIPGRSNFYVSPMKDSPFKSPRPKNEILSPSQMTPRSRTLYSFGEGPGSAEKLNKINEAMRAVKRASEQNKSLKSQKRLKFDQDDIDQSDLHAFDSNGIQNKFENTANVSGLNNNNGTAAIIQRKLGAIAAERSAKSNSKAKKRKK